MQCSQELYVTFKKVLIPKEQYQNTIEEITESSKLKQQTAHQYHLFRKYEVSDFGYVKKLRRKWNNPNETLLYFVSIEDTFDVTERTHIATGRSGRDKELSKKYVDITQEALNLFNI